jgi:hypothetical protein
MQLAAVASVLSFISPSARLLLGVPRLTRSTVIAASEEIPFDIFFLRAAKTALRQALEAESGALDEDALATVEALSQANPTEPDPSADVDLWSGQFRLASSTLSLAHAQIEQCGACRVVISEDGQLDLTGTLALGSNEEQAKLSVRGRVHATAEKELELVAEGIALTGQAVGCESLVAAGAQAAGLQPCGLDGFQWAAKPICLRQLYLDQDCHILQPLDDEGASGVPLILFKEL